MSLIESISATESYRGRCEDRVDVINEDHRTVIAVADGAGGIGSGKFNSMMCLYETNTKTMTMETVGTQREYFRSLIVNHKPDLVNSAALSHFGFIDVAWLRKLRKPCLGGPR